MALSDSHNNPSVSDTVCEEMVDTFQADPNYQAFTLHCGDLADNHSEDNWQSSSIFATNTNIREMLANLQF